MFFMPQGVSLSFWKIGEKIMSVKTFGIISHFLVNVFNLLVLVMLNIIVPEHGYIPALELLFIELFK